MIRIQRKPFLSVLWIALSANLLVAAALTGIGLLDMIRAPFAQWQSGQPAPTTYRATADQRCAFDELLDSVSNTHSTPGRTLVRRGQTVDLVILKDLARLIPERKELDLKRSLGVFTFYFLVLTFLVIVLRRNAGHLEQRFRAVGTVYFLLLMSALISRLTFDLTSLSLYAAPIALLALLLGPMLRQTSILAIHMAAVAILGPMITFTPGMLITPLVAGWTALLLIRSDSGPTRIMLAAGAGAGMGAVILVGLKLFTPDSIDLGLTLHSDLVGIVGGMVLSGVLAVLLTIPTALMFGTIPRSHLAKLRDMEHPVLRDLAQKAPGTFQHTMAVANMAEKVALDIGADDEVTRIGAYYHDIGKMPSPTHFSENQQGENPHDQLTPLDSAAVLRSHVTDGITIARGANLPERVVDFIVEHHGDSTMDYFLDKASRAAAAPQEAHPYSYGGRNPTSRETAVLMIVDSVEAAVRSLKEPAHDSLVKLVRQIVFGKLHRGYLDNSGLSTRDLKLISRSLVEILEAQFHVRVEYPWQKQAPDQEQQQDTQQQSKDHQNNG